MEVQKLIVTSPSFREGDWIPRKHSARGEDISPSLHLEGIADNAQSLAVIFDDASHPIWPYYNHWVLWNIPVRNVIPEGIPRGKCVEALGGAVQGKAYGRHRYKGPKPPFRAVHTYVFTVVTADCMVDLPPDSKKADLLNSLEGHILQKGTLSGKFRSRG